MPEFASPFSVMKNDRMLTDTETLRALRFSIAAEFEAIQVYEQLAESIGDEDVVKVLMGIADEERVHVGELQRVLLDLSPEEAEKYDEGADEVAELTASNLELGRVVQSIIAKLPPKFRRTVPMNTGTRTHPDQSKYNKQQRQNGKQEMRQYQGEAREELAMELVRTGSSLSEAILIAATSKMETGMNRTDKIADRLASRMASQKRERLGLGRYRKTKMPRGYLETL